MHITKISIQRPTLVVVLFTVLISLGLFGYFNLNYELLPKMSAPVITINTPYPGASPYEVENSVTKEVEDAVSSLEGVDKISSTSLESVSLVTVELEQDIDVDLALQEAQRKVNGIRNEFPDDAEEPALGKFDLDDLPIMKLGVAATMPATDLYDLVENKIQPQLGKIRGVAQVDILGGQEREIKINLNREKLSTYNLSVLQVSQAIQGANLNFPTGKIKSSENQTLIRLSGKFSSMEQIRNLVVVSMPNGSPVRLRDVAEVLDSKKDAEIISRVNGSNAIGLNIRKQSDANTVEVSKRSREIMDELEKTYAGDGLNFAIASDNSEFTLEAANAVIHDLLFAIFLVALVMLLFLQSLRNAVIVMIAVPASIISTFTAMMLMDFTLNLMTLLGLSLVVGILVDDAIVVIENIYRHLEMGKKRAQAAYDGIREIGTTIVSITMVIVAVFIPISLTGGIISNILTQFSVVVAISTLFSLLVAFTLIPLLASRFSKISKLSNKSLTGKAVNKFEDGLKSFERGMANALKWSFNRKALVLGIAFVLFAGSFALVGLGFIGSEFVASGDRGEFTIEVEMPRKTTVEENNRLSRRVENFIAQDQRVKKVSSTVGQSSGQLTTTNTPYKSEINVQLVNQDKRDVSTKVLSREMQIDLQENIAGAKFKATPVSMVGGGNQAPIQLVLSGTDLDSILQFAEKARREVAKIPGTAETELSIDKANPELKVEVDRDKMARLGLDLQTVGASMQTAFSGNDDAQYRDGENEYDINIKLDEFDRRDAEDIANLKIPNKAGQQIELGQFATIVEGTGPSQLERIDKVPTVTIESQVIGRPVGTVGDEITGRMKEMQVPEGMSFSMEGDLENQQEAFGSLFFALFSSLFLVYLIMVALYNSYVYPLVVMFSLPLAVVGALLALALTMSSLSIFSILGMIMLIGLVAKNAILVVDFTNQLKDAGLEVKEALLKATEVRIRPILMTTLAMVIGMMPIALASGAGAEWKNGLAWVLIGGLTSSMFLTLIVVPLVYYIFDRILARFGLDKQKEIELKETPRDELNSEIEETIHENGNENEQDSNSQNGRGNQPRPALS